MTTDRLMQESARPMFAAMPSPATVAAPHAAALAPHHAPASSRPRLAAVPLDAVSAFLDAADRHALPANDFLVHLRREVRRSTRSGAALSVAMYRAAPRATGGALQQLAREDATLEALHHAKRETDLLGHVGDDLLAVLCPDTDAAGIATFTHKVDALLAQVDESRAGPEMVASFPDPLFQHLAEARGPAAARRLVDTARPASGDAPTGYPVKRLLDVVGALTALVLLAPLMAVVALLVKLGSPGPVIFRQTRMGHGGRPFTFYKFRSMRVDTDDRVHREFVARFVAGQGGSAGAANAPQVAAAAPYKLKSDPRITPLGAFLRRSSIDELPQFFNVLKGDMSLVGPRPAIPYEVEHYQTWHLRRILTARPGITGLWQVEGRSRVTFNDMVRMDLRYIRECSLGLDLRIMAKTFIVVFRADGAA